MCGYCKNSDMTQQYFPGTEHLPIHRYTFHRAVSPPPPPLTHTHKCSDLYENLVTRRLRSEADLCFFCTSLSLCTSDSNISESKLHLCATLVKECKLLFRSLNLLSTHSTNIIQLHAALSSQSLAKCVCVFAKSI